MKVNRFFSAFLILALMVQSLPIRQVVDTILPGNKDEVELVESGSPEQKCTKVQDDDQEGFFYPSSVFQSLQIPVQPFRFGHNITIPAFHAPDIHTPPPDPA